MTRRVAVPGIVTLVAAACAGGGSNEPSEPVESSRAVTIRTTACGDTSRTTGSGVVVADGLVVTAAHVVIGATDVFVRSGGSDELVGDVVGLDTVNDLALVQAGVASGSEPVALTELADDQVATLMGGAASGDVDVEVLRRVTIDVAEVGGSQIVRRDGHELRGVIDGGDSGAGVFDSDGRLGAIVFAEPSASRGSDGTEFDRFFATASAAVGSLVDSGDRRSHACDPQASRLVADSG